MRWVYEQVDFEAGGKDHSSQGGSYDTGKELVYALWGVEPPEYLAYDFVMIKGVTGKMSSSRGELFTVSQLLEIYEPAILRWIFANQKPNHDFALAFDEDVIRTYDEYDRFLTSDDPFQKRVHRFTRITDEPLPVLPSFRVLCNQMQILQGNALAVWDRFYAQSHFPKQAFLERCQRAWRWVTTYAPENFCYQLRTDPLPIENIVLHEACQRLIDELDHPVDVLQERIWSMIHEVGGEPKRVFAEIYRRLIGRDQGPKLPQFMKDIGKDRLRHLL
jgi:lysyl-tRNA synthetase class 1